MAETFRSDGKAVDVVAPKDVVKGDPVVASGFVGIAMGNVASGNPVAIEVAQREHAVNVSGLTAPMGTKLYITSTGTLSTTASGNTLFGKVSRAKDANSIAWVILAGPQV